jgi:hypothetical protein
VREGRARRWPNSGRRRQRYPFKGGVGRRVGQSGETEGAQARRDMARAASIGPRPAGAGGGVAALQRRAAGRARLTCGTGRRRGSTAATGCGASVTARRSADTWPRSTLRAVYSI